MENRERAFGAFKIRNPGRTCSVAGPGLRVIDAQARFFRSIRATVLYVAPMGRPSGRAERTSNKILGSFWPKYPGPFCRGGARCNTTLESGRLSQTSIAISTHFSVMFIHFQHVMADAQALASVDDVLKTVQVNPLAKLHDEDVSDASHQRLTKRLAGLRQHWPCGRNSTQSFRQ
jgi:hypothetical protein